MATDLQIEKSAIGWYGSLICIPDVSSTRSLFPSRHLGVGVMTTKPTYKELEQRVKALEAQSHEWRYTEEALRETNRRLELAYDQSIIYARQLRAEISERKRIEEGLRDARKDLEVRVEQRTADLSTANRRLKCEIAERRDVEEALRIEADNLVKILNAMEDMVYIINEQHDMHYGNPTLVHTFGPFREKKCYDYFHGRSEVCPWCKSQEVFSGKSVRWEWESSRSGRVYEVIDTLMKRPKGDLSKLAILRDVTERKRLEQKKRRLEATLLRARKMEALGRLAGGIAHEFYEIIGMIVGNAELALYSILKEEPAQRNLEEILKACIRGEDVVSQILAFSRRGGTKKTPLAVGSVVQETTELFKATLPPGVEIRQDIRCNSGRALADRTQIQQVILNLCSNAAWAMRERGGAIEVSLTEVCIERGTAAPYSDLDAGSYLRITVSDKGPGIDPRIRDRIFDPYFSTKGNESGGGMGLAIVDGIVESHGGVVAIESEVEKGTDVHVFLPKIEEERERRAREAREYPLLGNERILFVDDEESIVDMGRQMLESLGYNVTAERDSAKALALFRAAPEQFDLVITDETMPVMTGKTLAEELLRIRSDLPIILCSVRSEDINQKEAESLGIRGFLSKPMVTRAMAETIREVLHEK
jgi:signal transduction histidine kinase/ActR/RegA family two-component response regulator